VNVLQEISGTSSAWRLNQLCYPNNAQIKSMRARTMCLQSLGPLSAGVTAESPRLSGVSSSHEYTMNPSCMVLYLPFTMEIFDCCIALAAIKQRGTWQQQCTTVQCKIAGGCRCNNPTVTLGMACSLDYIPKPILNVPHPLYLEVQPLA
jgi:hypothetical protein